MSEPIVSALAPKATAPAAAAASPLSAPHDGSVEVGGHRVGRGRPVVQLHLLDRAATRDQVGQAALVRLPADELLGWRRVVAARERAQERDALLFLTAVVDRGEGD